MSKTNINNINNNNIINNENNKNAPNALISLITLNNKKDFRIQSKKLFLTYSQVQDRYTKEELLEFLSLKCEVKKYLICEEEHKTLGYHFHVYLELNKKCNVVNCKFFDFKGHHGKYESCKNYYAAKKYITKDGNYITNIEDTSFNNYMMDAKDLAKEGKIEEALFLIIDNYPKEIKFLDRYKKNFELVYKMTRNINKNLNFKYPLSCFKYDEYKKDLEIFDKLKYQKSLYIYGGSGNGKTQFIKTYFSEYNPLRVGHMDKLKKLNYKNKCIIFDDMNFNHWFRESIIHLLTVDEDNDINVKCSMVTIPENTIKIFISNFHWRDIFPAHDKAIRRRLYTINIEDRLF